MVYKVLGRLRWPKLLLLGVLLALVFVAGAPPSSPALEARPASKIMLPLVSTTPWNSPFGVEYFQQYRVMDDQAVSHLRTLGVSKTRLNFRIEWKELQPTENSPILWHLLADFENELRMMRAANVTPVIVLNSSPYWATINQPVPTSCGAIRSDKFGAYAAFVRAMVNRYKSPEFNVHQWELGNEPDVDPALVRPDDVFGCWGDSTDPFYGGRHYGEMLKAVTPAIREEDPGAVVWVGGLLLNQPQTDNNNVGKPENFFRGILEAGAAPYFDIVGYHAYAPFWTDVKVDHEFGGPWGPLGGYVVGKANFLNQVMQEYGVSKPLVANEVGLMCPESVPVCNGPATAFKQAQATHSVRTMVRGMGAGISGYSWFTLNDSGWRSVGMLEGNAPKPVYRAFWQLNQQLKYSRFVGPVEYTNGVEAFEFQRSGQRIHIVWTRDNVEVPLRIPQSSVVRVLNRDGHQIQPVVAGTDYQVTARFEPIYLILKP